MSFYVILPSDTRPQSEGGNGLPSNKQNFYTTLMNPPLMLSEPYEVALTDFSYSTHIKVDLGKVTIIWQEPYNNNQLSVTHEMVYRENMTIAEFCQDINQYISINVNHSFNDAVKNIT
jgi:hypothetical protein